MSSFDVLKYITSETSGSSLKVVQHNPVFSVIRSGLSSLLILRWRINFYIVSETPVDIKWCDGVTKIKNLKTYILIIVFVVFHSEHQGGRVRT